MPTSRLNDEHGPHSTLKSQAGIPDGLNGEVTQSPSLAGRAGAEDAYSGPTRKS